MSKNTSNERRTELEAHQPTSRIAAEHISKLEDQHQRVCLSAAQQNYT